MTEVPADNKRFGEIGE